jgi:hypothetical protein
MNKQFNISYKKSCHKEIPKSFKTPMCLSYYHTLKFKTNILKYDLFEAGKKHTESIASILIRLLLLWITMRQCSH